MNERLQLLSRRIVQAEELLKSDGWKELLLPEIEKRRGEHIEGCCNPDLTAEKRSEHIEAVRLSKDLAGFLEKQLRSDLAEVGKIKKKA
jgi:hypothetical protein